MDKQRLNYPWLSQLVEAGKDDDCLESDDVHEFLNCELSPSTFVNIDLNWCWTPQGDTYWRSIYDVLSRR